MHIYVEAKSYDRFFPEILQFPTENIMQLSRNISARSLSHPFARSSVSKFSSANFRHSMKKPDKEEELLSNPLNYKKPDNESEYAIRCDKKDETPKFADPKENLVSRMKKAAEFFRQTLVLSVLSAFYIGFNRIADTYPSPLVPMR